MAAERVTSICVQREGAPPNYLSSSVRLPHMGYVSIDTVAATGMQGAGHEFLELRQLARRRVPTRPGR
jgi:hypothetical protein